MGEGGGCEEESEKKSRKEPIKGKKHLTSTISPENGSGTHSVTTF